MRSLPPEICSRSWYSATPHSKENPNSLNVSLKDTRCPSRSVSMITPSWSKKMAWMVPTEDLPVSVGAEIADGLDRQTVLLGRTDGDAEPAVTFVHLGLRAEDQAALQREVDHVLALYPGALGVEQDVVAVGVEDAQTGDVAQRLLDEHDLAVVKLGAFLEALGVFQRRHPGPHSDRSQIPRDEHGGDGRHHLRIGPQVAEAQPGPT